MGTNLPVERRVIREPLPSTSQDYSSSSDSENFEDDEASSETWTIVHRKELNRVLEQSVNCRFCESDCVNFEEVSSTGLGAKWVVRCKNEKCASHQMSASFHTTPKTNRFYDINRELVLGLRLVGRGQSAAQKVLSILNLPRPVSSVSWTAHTKALEQAASELLERELQNAMLQVKRCKLDNGDLDANINSSITDEQLKDIVVDAGVSIDGSWNSRGWSARDGMVAVVSIDTGKVLDVIFLSNSCSACEQKKREQREGKISKRDFLGWFVGHEENCYLNHEGSSQSMEAEGACRLYGRSLQKHKLRYIPFVGDGDSKSYAEVKKMAPYGASVFIPKEDCIGHVTKRMGTALRKLQTTYKGKKLDDGKGLGGKGRLTLTRIDTLQNFYGKAIRDNKGDAKAMSKATHAILKHYSSTPEQPRHEDCPMGKDSWCSYNRDQATGQATHAPIKDPIPDAVVKVLQPTFDRLGSEEFLIGCEKCLDQNNNESLHHVAWGMAPKEQYTSQQETSLAVSLSVLVFNNGVEDTISKLLVSMDIPVHPDMPSQWGKIDSKRMAESDYKTDPIVKQRRKRLRREKSKKQDAFVHQEGVMYSSQSFYNNAV